MIEQIYRMSTGDEKVVERVIQDERYSLSSYGL